MSAGDWTEVLAAQGVDPARIADAKTTAEGHAALALALPHDPRRAADPSVFAALLRAEALR